jgi:hypothetical protein
MKGLRLAFALGAAAAAQEVKRRASRASIPQRQYQNLVRNLFVTSRSPVNVMFPKCVRAPSGDRENQLSHGKYPVVEYRE